MKKIILIILVGLSCFAVEDVNNTYIITDCKSDYTCNDMDENEFNTSMIDESNQIENKAVEAKISEDIEVR